MTRSLEKLSEVIAAIHEAAVEPAAWETALKGIVGFVGGQSGSLRSADTKIVTGDIAVVKSHFGEADYYHYTKLDPLLPVVLKAPTGHPVAGGLVYDREEFFRSEFYNDFARTNDAIDCAMMRFDADAGSVILGVGRNHTAGMFDSADADILKLFYPHLSQAFRVGHHLLECGDLGTDALEVLGRLRHGVLLAGGNGQVLYMNSAAQEIVGMADGLTIKENRLQAAGAADDRVLLRAMAGASSADACTLAIERPSGTLPFILHVSSLPRKIVLDQWHGKEPGIVLVLISRPYDIHYDVTAALRKIFGLTAAEAAVADAVSKTHSVKIAARRLNCAPSTVRWHLRSVFHKTRISGQPELIKLLERMVDSAP